MDRKSSTRGFTLAELLIVVAIIAVLVAIAIPVFSSQLEKSREATDLANVRSAYAEVMTAAITEDKTATYDGKVMYDSSNGLYTTTVSPLAQKQDGWTIDTPITIGGVTSGPNGDTNADATWKNAPTAGGSCTIICGSDGKVIINWGDGSNSPTNPDTPSDGSVYDKLITSADELTTGKKTCLVGNVYKYEGKYYVCTTGTDFEKGEYANNTPTGWAQAKFREIRSDAKIFDKPDITDNGRADLSSVKSGDIYQLGSDYYICTVDSSPLNVPSAGNTDGRWVKINYSTK